MGQSDMPDSMDWGVLRPGLVRFLSKRTGCKSTAEDLTQDLWFRVQSGREGVRSPISYIFRAAANLATDHHRAERRRAALNSEAMALVLGDHDSLPSPEEQLGASEHLDHVYATLDALPPRTRQIFSMNRFDGISYRDIAVTLGISTTSVERHMRRALAALAGLRDETF
jgi:RNA polymerase sigma factor (sigma-70 family)